MEYRYEKDFLGEILVPKQCLWGAQTQRTLKYFQIGNESMPTEIIKALAYIKKACAFVNRSLLSEKMTAEKAGEISHVCDEIIDDRLNSHFPLSIWQTGSGTHTNMNVNEVIANRCNERMGKRLVNANDDVNMSQSSNDVFPSAMHIAAVLSVENGLIPAIENLIKSFQGLERRCEGIMKIGRTHLQDALPIAFSQEISGWRTSLEIPLNTIKTTLMPLKALALGGMAVGTGVSTPKAFSITAVNIINSFTNNSFYPAENKFHALSSKDELVASHGAIKSLAVNLMKIANDIKKLASGPRCGLGEIRIPVNEPGSLAMPGKANPTQCEAVTMVAVQVMANDTAIGIAAAQGDLELNAFMPLIAYDYLQSVRLLRDVVKSFTVYCVDGIEPNRDKMKENLDNSLSDVAFINSYLGYERSAKAYSKAYTENISLKDACVALGYLTDKEFDKIIEHEINQ